MTKPPAKTNAVRELEKLAIAMELREYAVDQQDLSAVHAARELAIPVEQIFKTLVLRAGGRAKDILVASIPGDLELDPKKLAALAGKGRVEMVHQKELFELTGYVRGGCSPLAMKRRYPYYLHSSALNHGIISISAGRQGLQILLDPRDLVRATGAVLGDLVRRSP